MIPLIVLSLSPSACLPRDRCSVERMRPAFAITQVAVAAPLAECGSRLSSRRRTAFKWTLILEARDGPDQPDGGGRQGRPRRAADLSDALGRRPRRHLPLPPGPALGRLRAHADGRAGDVASRAV